MSDKTFITSVQKELETLNREIDLKILKGLPYKKEASRHKLILNELGRLDGSRTWVGRTAHLVSSFIL